MDSVKKDANEASKDADIGWHRFADLVDSLSYCLSKSEATKGLQTQMLESIDKNRENVNLDFLLGLTRVEGVEKAFNALYDLLYGEDRYQKLFMKQPLDASLDSLLEQKLPDALFSLSRFIRNHPLMDQSGSSSKTVRSAFLYRSVCFFLAKKLQDAYKDFLFATLDWGSDAPIERSFQLHEDHIPTMRALHEEVSKQIDCTKLTGEQVRDVLSKLKPAFESLASASNHSDQEDSAEAVDVVVSSQVRVENEWKNRGRAFVANENIEARTRLFEESPIAQLIYDIQRRCEHCGKLLIQIEPYHQKDENGNGLMVSSFFPSFTSDSLVYCDLNCARYSHTTSSRRILRPLLFEMGVACLPLKSIIAGEEVSDVLNKWNSFKQSSDRTDLSRQDLVFKLMNHIDEHDKDNLVSYTLVTAFVVHCFVNKFELITSDEQRAEFERCLLHQLLTLSTNVISIQNQIEDNTEKIIGVGLYPSIAILNHSCKPNLVPIFSGTKLILETSTSVEQGAEVFFCYDTDLKNMDLDERRTYFKTNYFFECDCIACLFDQRDFSEALLCSFTPKDSTQCRKAAFVKGEKIVCRNVSKHEMQHSKEICDQVEKIEERYKFGNRMSQIFDQSEEADDATQAFLALNEACKLAQNILHPMNELSLMVNRGIIKIYCSMGHYSHAIAHSKVLVSTFRNNRNYSWEDVLHEIVRESDRLIQLHLLDFEDTRPTRTTVVAVGQLVDRLQQDYEELLHRIGQESFESYYSGRIVKLEEYREQLLQF